MTYFLDFDRTVFDTSTFIKYVIERDSLQHLLSLSEADIAASFDELAVKDLLRFSPGETERFLYDDARVFLKDNAPSIVMVTAGNPTLQQIKLESTFHNEPRLTIFYTGDERKGPFLKRLSEYESPRVFVDDKPMELDSVAEHCPDITLYEMRRDGKSGSGKYPVLESFLDIA